MLPQGYTRVEYIESTGGQYIDTGVNPDSNIGVVADVQHVDYSDAKNYFFYFGCGDGTNTFAIGDAASNENLIRFYYGGTNYGNTWNVPVGDRRTIVIDKGSATVDGVTKSYANYSFSFNIPLYLFGSNSSGTLVYNARMRLYSCRIYDNGTLVRDYIPCQTDTGEVGLYDMATATFYGNDGTGEFIASPGVIDAPEAPQEMRAETSGSTATLTWSASAQADKYRVYRDYSMIAETVSTKHIDTITDAPTARVYAVTAVSKYGESDFSPSARVEFWGDTAPELIYDRTLADVDDAKALISKYMRGEVLDGYEQELWDKGLRGCYNTSDVNRVEYHTRELQNILNSNGYNIHIDTRLWAKPDVMRYSDIIRYLGNIKTILDVFGRSANAPKLPGIDRWIDYIAANDIEKILYVTRELIYGALAMFRRAGTFRAGGDYLAQVIRRA